MSGSLVRSGSRLILQITVGSWQPRNPRGPSSRSLDSHEKKLQDNSSAPAGQ
jgi:hypothetical protein